ncbi:hypothetical protein [Lentzea kentuckyensis]|uniref:hypothetical protein n=1 Tax=Lentzea kentuckyensis TaxID=360086 RepID=UPI000A3BE625|nr:hypothetical protein [Lentzea kentuckyensis]
MTTHADRVARGRAARRKGHQAERDLAAYLRRWWPDAERKPDNGWRSGDRVSADVGDIRGVPGVVWQCKNVDRLNINKAMEETATQAVVAEADYGVLVERRPGRADPAEWWAWVTVSDIGRLLWFPGDLATWGVPGDTLKAPVRVELRHLVALLVADGYADPLRASETRRAP